MALRIEYLLPGLRDLNSIPKTCVVKVENQPLQLSPDLCIFAITHIYHRHTNICNLDCFIYLYLFYLHILMFYLFYVFYLFIFETGSYCITQAVLRIETVCVNHDVQVACYFLEPASTSLILLEVLNL